MERLIEVENKWRNNIAAANVVGVVQRINIEELVWNE